MDNTVLTKIYDAPRVVRAEILRYAGVKEADEMTLAIMEECLAEASAVLSYKVTFAVYSVTKTDTGLDLGFCKTASRDLMKNLGASHSVIVFCATVGLGIDRLIAKYKTISPARALMLQAIGTERIESLCDKFTEDMYEETGGLRPRFSPGYGDFEISHQRDIFLHLNPSKSIGVSLNESLLMSPSKSVTALVGVCGNMQGETGCKICKQKNCAYRRKL